MNYSFFSKNPYHLILCKLFGHKYQVLRSYQTNKKEYECCKCRQQFTENDHGELQPLTPKLRRINEVMEKFYIFRHARQLA
ncbi:DUF1660 family phage protein [Leeuwenhoekiella parthenopeia]|uniref:DUF1660 family phage protein n=1 Tax=Leeuwenhoekiella parthenopeia TaxID=2890320 RepID=A0ABS8GNH8_9FLAO|nr:DUF1660 family phage protein [Leeuwenhoekiella parthenopeia]MCC4211475.1 DUF1660 family phage protein [Leeuwenhoekiella parthenopeia]